jgi:hypothetical protein
VAIVSTVVVFAIWLISRVISVDTEITEELPGEDRRNREMADGVIRDVPGAVDR